MVVWKIGTCCRTATDDVGACSARDRRAGERRQRAAYCPWPGAVAMIFRACMKGSAMEHTPNQAGLNS